MVTVNIVYVDVLQATLIVDIGVARVSLELLDYKLFRLCLILVSYASIKSIDVFNDLDLVAFCISRSYEFLRITFAMKESVSSSSHAVTDWRHIPISLMVIAQLINTAFSEFFISLC